MKQMFLVFVLVWGAGSVVHAQESDVSSDGQSISTGDDGHDSAAAAAADEAGEKPVDEGNADLELRAKIAEAEAEKAKADAQRAQAEAEKMAAEARKAEAEAAGNSQANGAVNGDSAASSSEKKEEEEDEEEERPNHRGFYFRFTPGLGIGTVWGKGTLDPLPGLERIDDPKHSSITGSLALDLGGGIVKNLALHVGVFFEKPFLRDTQHEMMAFNMFGLSAGLSWYFTEHDLFLTGQLRLVKMLVKFPTVACTEYFIDTFDWYTGPGASITFGKEWYEDAEDDGAFGLGLQGNFYRMHGGIDDHFAFNYLSLLIVMTLTHF